MERAVRPEIFRNKRTTFQGIPHAIFPFHLAGTEIPVPFAHFCFCRRLAPGSWNFFRHFQRLSVSVVHGQLQFFLFISYRIVQIAFVPVDSK